jgi:hypothetical protein
MLTDRAIKQGIIMTRDFLLKAELETKACKRQFYIECSIDVLNACIGRDKIIFEQLLNKQIEVEKDFKNE